MKQTLVDILTEAFSSAKHQHLLPEEAEVDIHIERTKDPKHGHYATNMALLLAKPCKKNPKQLAQDLIKCLPEHESIEKVEIAGPGFINFFIHEGASTNIIKQVLNQGADFGSNTSGQHQKVLIEFVSANPTGPLHVGHGRGAAYGATLANLLSVSGFDVTTEYYVNDAGRQMNILAVSVWLRYLSLLGESFDFPSNAYRGDYVIEMAQSMKDNQGNAYHVPWVELAKDLPLDEPQGGDKERYIDELIHRGKTQLGEKGFQAFHQLALQSVLEGIKSDLDEFGVRFDQWFSEKSLLDDGSIQKGIQALIDSGHTYKEERALWFKATDYGDEKDRVLVRANGQTTYFASDVAYHWHKYDRGFDRVIDIFGADHHGYMTRVKAAVHALGHDDNALTVLLVQFAILYQGGKRVQMSTRSGSFVTLRDLYEDVGTDAARFFYVTRKPQQHMDFDLDVAKSQSNENPVYYIQYAHARICSVMRQLEKKGFQHDHALGLLHLPKLTESNEKQLIRLLDQYQEVIKQATHECQPHQISYYLKELATALHAYYNAVILLCEEDDLRAARMCLLAAVRQVIVNGLNILGVSAPESM